VSRSCASSIQVREARTSLSGVIVACAIFGFMILEILCCCGCLDCLDILFGICICVMQARTVASADNLAQASLPRLGKISRGSPKTFHASCRSGDQTLILSEKMSRSGEGGLA